MNSEKAEKKPKIKKVLRVTGDVALFFIILFFFFFSLHYLLSY